MTEFATGHVILQNMHFFVSLLIYWLQKL